MHRGFRYVNEVGEYRQCLYTINAPNKNGPANKNEATNMDYVVNHWRLIAAVVAGIIFLLIFRQVLALCGVIIVADDSVGVMTKKFVLVGKSRLPAGRIIALNGEAGYQADTLPPGLHL